MTYVHCQCIIACMYVYFAHAQNQQHDKLTPQVCHVVQGNATVAGQTWAGLTWVMYVCCV